MLGALQLYVSMHVLLYTWLGSGCFLQSVHALCLKREPHCPIVKAASYHPWWLCCLICLGCLVVCGESA
jgi:hypothetical protein